MLKYDTLKNVDFFYPTKVDFESEPRSVAAQCKLLPLSAFLNRLCLPYCIHAQTVKNTLTFENVWEFAARCIPFTKSLIAWQKQDLAVIKRVHEDSMSFLFFLVVFSILGGLLGDVRYYSQKK